MLWISLLKRFWPYIAGALLIIGVFIWYRAQISEAQERGYNQAQAEFRIELEQEQERWRRHQDEVNQEIDREHYEELSTLQRRVRRLLASNDAIRMCEPVAGDVSNAAGTGQPDAAGANGGPTYRAGEDLQPRLAAYGAGCEALRQQVEGWQRWFAAISESPR
jgi:hypothetical protein